MSGGTALAATLALAAGLAGSVQAAVMGRFGERIGSLEALAWATLLWVVMAMAALVVFRRCLDGLGDAWAAPKWPSPKRINPTSS